MHMDRRKDKIQNSSKEFHILVSPKKNWEQFMKKQFLWIESLEIWNENTVKPMYNGHPWDPKKASVWKRGMIKVRFRLFIDESNQPLSTGGRCSDVVVKVVWLYVKYFYISYSKRKLRSLFKTNRIFSWLPECFHQVMSENWSSYSFALIVRVNETDRLCPSNGGTPAENVPLEVFHLCSWEI